MSEQQKCEHDLAERETACADGLCPLCLQSENARLRESQGRVAIRFTRWRAGPFGLDYATTEEAWAEFTKTDAYKQAAGE